MEIYSLLNQSLEPEAQQVEVATTRQIPGFYIVGLASKEVMEARERIRSALLKSGLSLPKRKIIVNLKPADIRKKGTGTDLPIALALVFHSQKDSRMEVLSRKPERQRGTSTGCVSQKDSRMEVLSRKPERQRGTSTGCVSQKDSRMEVLSRKPERQRGTSTGCVSQKDSFSHLPQRILAWGELGLNGELISKKQTFRAAYLAWKKEAEVLVLPYEEIRVAQVAFKFFEEEKIFITPKPRILGAQSLGEVLYFLQRKDSPLPKPKALLPNPHLTEPKVIAASAVTLMKLPALLERALCLALTGHHHLMILGKKGSGKSRIIDWIEALSPRVERHLKLSQFFISDLRDEPPTSMIHKPIVRVVHSNIRPTQLYGRISQGEIQPGEFCLAHGGVLFADEFPEWPRDARESLRSPLESEEVILLKELKKVALPAAFLFIGTGNLCPCGQYSLTPPPESLGARCRCTENDWRKYRARLSGPILDRLDMIVSPDLQHNPQTANPIEIAFVRDKIASLRKSQIQRFGTPVGRMSPVLFERYIEKFSFFKDQQSLVEGLSLRRRHKVFKLSFTLASWEGVEIPTRAHVLEAMELSSVSLFE